MRLCILHKKTYHILEDRPLRKLSKQDKICIKEIEKRLTCHFMTRISRNQQELKNGWNFRKGASARQQGYFAYFYTYQIKYVMKNAI